jgi:hypothetical protein
MNTAQELKTADNGYQYLKDRFLRKEGKYFDCSKIARPKYDAKDLAQVLVDRGWPAEAVHSVQSRLRRLGQDLSVWSGCEVFRPNQSRIIRNENGTSDINNWTASDVIPSDGDVTPFLDYLDSFIPVAEDREYLLDLIAYRYQNPTVKQQHGAIIYSEEQGIGKSRLKNVIAKVFGNTQFVNTVDGLVDKYSNPNWSGSWIVAEEIKVTAGGTVYNKLKSKITEEFMQGERKNVDFATFQIPATLLLLTNYEPSFIEPKDRRFFIIEAKTKLAEGEIVPYMTRLDAWLAEGGYEAIAAFLAARDVSRYSPYRAPPVNATKRRLIGLVGSGIGQDVADWIDGRAAFTERAITEAFKPHQFSELRHHLKGYQKFCGTKDGRLTIHGTKERVWHKGDTRIVYKDGGVSELHLEDGTVLLLKKVIDDDSL